ncbi:TraR/DksA family transcriptional regulator [Streptomyces sedi]|uniref:Molecular chaperone DnaK n=1 Tax=Streptomyces sedi TaxID=555059 RepID=A0A5C4UR81_9ACTN|nr:TraR/DksA C4-type zinc finger protein [Streptomyces sedi]TNM26074.1 molecular chaperone DnaK [Streptomyces sedi]
MAPETSRPPAERLDERQVRERLAHERATRLEQSRALDESANGAANDALTVTQRGAVRSALEDIDAALARLDAGTYGDCQGCAAPIPAGRLEILPHARLCVPCRERAG